MKLAANISLLYGGMSINEQLACAAADGFQNIEILSPYDVAPQVLADGLLDHGLNLILINTPSTQFESPMGLAAHPDQIHTFKVDMERAANVCQATGCRQVHVMAGSILADYTYQQQIDTLHHNLDWAHTQYPNLDFQLEALNSTDFPEYFYHDPAQVAEVLDGISGLPTGLQFDFYHVVKQGLSLTDSLARFYSRVVHVQVAGSPHRHEPNLKQDSLLEGFAFLHQAGYQGYIGLEYRPGGTSARQGLGWFMPLLEQGWASL